MTFDYLETGYAQAWDKISAGTVLLEWMLEDLFKHNPPRLIDFGAGPSAYKDRLANRRYKIVPLYLTAAYRWRCVFACQRLLDSGFQVIHRARPAAAEKIARVTQSTVRRMITWWKAVRSMRRFDGTLSDPVNFSLRHLPK